MLHTQLKQNPLIKAKELWNENNKLPQLLILKLQKIHKLAKDLDLPNENHVSSSYFLRAGKSRYVSDPVFYSSSVDFYDKDDNAIKNAVLK